MVVVAALVVLLFARPVVNVYTRYLWFDDLGYSSVMTTEVGTRLIIFAITGLVIGAMLFIGTYLAYRVRPAFLPTAPNDPVVRYRAAVTSRIKTFALLPAVIIGTMAGLIGQTSWETVQLFLHGGSFGQKDAQFNMDIGFFVFDLPFIRWVVNFLFIGIVLMFAANLVTHYLFGGLRLAGSESGLSRGARIQLGIIAGVFLLLKAVAYWFDRYQLVFSDRKDFRGAGYADIHALLPAKLLLMAIAVLCAVALFAGLVLRDLRIPALATALMVLAAAIIGFAWPRALEFFSVRPNPDKEYEYIQRNIEATRDAYNLNAVELEVESNPDASKRLSAEDAPALANARIMDPNYMAAAFQRSQGERSYFAFESPVTIDRYQVDGTEQDFLVAVRELDRDKLNPDQSNWTNAHLVYTHGNGLMAAPVSQPERWQTQDSSSAGTPAFQSVTTENLVQGQPGMFGITDPRVYFGPLIGNRDPDYAVVGATGDPIELDNDQRPTTFQGDTGVAVGGFVNKVAFAIKYGESNFLLNSRVGADSKVLFDRDPRDRVKAVAPWLTTDSKVYPIADPESGHIQWVVDGYTTLQDFPYAQQVSLQEATGQVAQTAAGARQAANEKISYMRNSVKAVVDAYDGSVNLYVQDENDPVLKAWMKTFSGVVKPKSEMPQALSDHLRYPEDIFKVQRDLLAKYHQSGAEEFFRNGDLWTESDRPKENANDNAVAQDPFYSMGFNPQDPGEPQFQLTAVFSPDRRPELAAQISASSDSDTYGQLTIRRFGAGLISGPDQVFQTLTATGESDGGLSYGDDLPQLNQQNKAFGNLVNIPLANGGLMYLMPLYVQGANRDQPRLARVFVFNADAKTPGYDFTLRGALLKAGYTNLDVALGKDGGGPATGIIEVNDPVDPVDTAGDGSNPPSSGSTTPSTTTSPSTSGAQVTPVVPQAGTPERTAYDALKTAMDEVEAASKGGDLARIGKSIEGLQTAIANYDQYVK